MPTMNRLVVKNIYNDAVKAFNMAVMAIQPTLINVPLSPVPFQQYLKSTHRSYQLRNISKGLLVCPTSISF